MRRALLLLLGACSAAPQLPPPRQPPGYPAGERRAQGERIDLPLAELFVPQGYAVPADGRVPLFVHFQGGVPVAEESFVRFLRPGVLIASKLSGRSSAFSQPYREPQAFRELLAAGEQMLGERAGRPVTFAPITITFFSAGYGAVREFLRHDEFMARIDNLISADSIYSDVLPGTRTPRPEQMAPFIAFARLAVAGKKVFVLGHSRIVTDYASTAETADARLAALDLSRQPSHGFTARGVPIASEAHRGGLHLFGFDEAVAGIHVDLLFAVPEWVQRYVP